jgi:hypothetical protein
VREEKETRQKNTFTKNDQDRVSRGDLLWQQVTDLLSPAHIITIIVWYGGTVQLLDGWMDGFSLV